MVDLDKANHKQGEHDEQLIFIATFIEIGESVPFPCYIYRVENYFPMLIPFPCEIIILSFKPPLLGRTFQVMTIVYFAYCSTPLHLVFCADNHYHADENSLLFTLSKFVIFLYIMIKFLLISFAPRRKTPASPQKSHNQNPSNLEPHDLCKPSMGCKSFPLCSDQNQYPEVYKESAFLPCSQYFHLWSPRSQLSQCVPIPRYTPLPSPNKFISSCTFTNHYLIYCLSPSLLQKNTPLILLGTKFQLLLVHPRSVCSYLQLRCQFWNAPFHTQAITTSFLYP